MRILGEHDRETMDACRAAGEFFWLDLVAPSREQLQGLGEHLGWNPLLVEDLELRERRAKIEDFDDHALVICYGATARDAQHVATTTRLLEQGLVVHGDYVVSVRNEPLEAIDRLHTSLVSNCDGVSEASVVHRILDAIVDTTTVVADAIADEVDLIELGIDIDVEATILDTLRLYRRDVVALRSTVVAQRDVFTSLAAALESIPGFDVGMRSHYRDITDHARRVVDRVEVARSLLDAAFEAYYTMLVARQGLIGQRLAVVATIFLPLTFITGFFGQNFGWLVEHISSERDFLWFGIGITGFATAALAAVFKRLRWW